MTSSRRSDSAHPAHDLEQEPVSCRMAKAVVDCLEAIQVHEEHRERVIRVTNSSPAGALQPFHEQGAVGELRQVVVKRIVKQALLRATQARAHFVEGQSHRRRFGAARHRHLTSPVAGRNVFRRGREILERPAHAPAEEHAAADGQCENQGAGDQQAATHFVDELLHGAPVLEQHQASCCVGIVAGRQRKNPNDVLTVADALHSVQRAEPRQPVPGGKKPGQRRPIGAGQAARREPASRDHVHIGMGDRREPTGDAVVESQSHGERPEDFVSKPRRLGHDQEKTIAGVDDGAKRAAGGRLADALADRFGWVDAGGPARAARPASVAIGEDAEVGLQLLPVVLAHRFQSRDVSSEP